MYKFNVSWRDMGFVAWCGEEAGAEVTTDGKGNFIISSDQTESTLRLKHSESTYKRVDDRLISYKRLSMKERQNKQ